ncbi:hypothetical protein P3S68_024870 [Capsicum galapagoense]
MADKTYSREEFLEHFNQIEDVYPMVAEFLTRVDFERWSRAFYPADRYNIMTSNIAKSLNSVFGDEREFPIKAMFEKISKKLFSRKIADYKFSITSHGDTATVDLQIRSCTCRFFDLDKIPCPHSIAALGSQYIHKYGTAFYEHSSQYYSVEKYEIAYSGNITPVPPKESWVVPAELMGRLIPPPYIDPSTIKSGRKSYKRRRGVVESFSSRRNKCSICKCAGYKRTKCPNHNPP